MLNGRTPSVGIGCALHSPYRRRSQPFPQLASSYTKEYIPFSPVAASFSPQPPPAPHTPSNQSNGSPSADDGSPVPPSPPLPSTPPKDHGHRSSRADAPSHSATEALLRPDSRRAVTVTGAMPVIREDQPAAHPLLDDSFDGESLTKSDLMELVRSLQRERDVSAPGSDVLVLFLVRLTLGVCVIGQVLKTTLAK